MDAARVMRFPAWLPSAAGPGPGQVRRRPDVWFVDLPHTTHELGFRFKSLWSFKQFVDPGEIHLGFRHMTAALQSAGFEARILYPSAAGPATREELAEEIIRGRPRLVGLTTYEGSLRETLDFVHLLRAGGATSLICLGGHLATSSYREILTDFPNLVDVIVLGEGEQTIVELASAVREGRPFRQVPGVAYRDRGHVRRSSPRPVEQNLDSLPDPVVIMPSGLRTDSPLFVTTSRGCYARCTFCRSAHFAQRWRPRDPVAVVDEIERAYGRGVRVFELVGDNFLGPGRRGRRRATAFAGELLRRGLNIRFHASGRVDDVDELTIIALREAGLISLSLGVESGVPRMLETFGKNVTVEKNEATLQLLNRLGIPTLVYVIFFDPYTTLEEVRENVAFLERINLLRNVRFEEIIFRRLIPVSGTALFDRLRNDGLLRGDYLSGYAFEFRDDQVRLLADFVETVDIGTERVFQDAVYREIPGLYSAIKERVELDLVARAVDFLQSHPGTTADAEAGLAQLRHQVLQDHLADGVVRQ